MKIGIIGMGKLGIPVAIGIERKGHEVMGYDINPKCKKDVRMKDLLYTKESDETGITPIDQYLEEETVQISDTMKKVIEFGEIIFVSVQTPHIKLYGGETRIPSSRKDFNYTYLVECVENISSIVNEIGQEKIVIIISTVLPGTIRREIFPVLSPLIKLVYNPFFIAMSTVIRDFYYPEFILFGYQTSKDDLALKKGTEFYKTITDRPIYATEIENAELIKVSYNTWISSKIMIVNNIMEMCDKLPNTNVDEVTNALKIATDRIVSPAYMSGGMADGGACFLKGQIVYTENGPVEIQDITIGTNVLSEDGKLYPVINTYTNQYKGKIFKIKSRGTPWVHCTDTHKFYVAPDLRDTYMTQGKEKYRTTESLIKQIGDIEEIESQYLSTDYYTILPKPREINVNIP